MYSPSFGLRCAPRFGVYARRGPVSFLFCDREKTERGDGYPPPYPPPYSLWFEASPRWFEVSPRWFEASPRWFEESPR
eukprot:829333-Prorocentrum_minimum.AAC.2